MIVLGIDVGFAICGWAIVEKVTGKKAVLHDFGIIETHKDEAIPFRLQKLHKGLTELIIHYKPKEIAIEEIFYFKNQKTVVNVAQARGVILLTAELHKLDIYGYTPLQVKQSLTGYGRAEKKQMQKMVQSYFKLESIPKPDDAADAIAIAVCHINSSTILKHDRLHRG